MKLTKLFFLIFLTITISCSEGAINFDQAAVSSDKILAIFNSNITQILEDQEKVLADFSGGKLFLSNAASPIQEPNTEGLANFNISYGSVLVENEIQWSSSVVERVPIKLRFSISGETAHITLIQLIATPSGLNFDYGGEIPYYFNCYEFPDVLDFVNYVSCGIKYDDFFFSNTWSSKSYQRSNNTLEFRFSRTSFDLRSNFRKENEEFFPDGATGSGEIIKNYPGF